MFILIDKTNLEKHKDILRVGLSRALDKTTLGVHWDLDSLYSEIEIGWMYAFHQIESGFSGAFSINRTPKGSVLYFFWSGKDPANKIPVNYKEVDERLMHLGRIFRCNEVSCEGRKGWKSILLPLGYAEDSVVYTKEVTYEYP